MDYCRSFKPRHSSWYTFNVDLKVPFFLKFIVNLRTELAETECHSQTNDQTVNSRLLCSPLETLSSRHTALTPCSRLCFAEGSEAAKRRNKSRVQP